jgi:hypothetical protein
MESGRSVELSLQKKDIYILERVCNIGQRLRNCFIPDLTKSFSSCIIAGWLKNWDGKYIFYLVLLSILWTIWVHRAIRRITNPLALFDLPSLLSFLASSTPSLFLSIKCICEQLFLAFAPYLFSSLPSFPRAVGEITRIEIAFGRAKNRRI